ncbi:unnamed protein product [Protopolystoma xenopodis]|uniref:Uncharacterized protein n=1 Tax=Protopolystoma xenopodis TaxID=117903 RepID=A0A3S5B9K7_9PLAT|nr:unnamed protein product [Protopolystoma xenopodis]
MVSDVPSVLKLEVLVSADEDLKLSDTLRYYTADSGAAKQLLYRRARALADYENANRTLDKVRIRANAQAAAAGGGSVSSGGQNVASAAAAAVAASMSSATAGSAVTAIATLATAEQSQIKAYERFNDISEQARKGEIKGYLKYGFFPKNWNMAARYTDYYRTRQGREYEFS